MKVKICISQLVPQTVQVLSSRGDRYYEVTAPTLYTAAVCDPECKGYIYRGYCRHVEVAREFVCDWATEDMSVTNCPCGKEAILFDPE